MAWRVAGRRSRSIALGLACSISVTHVVGAAAQGQYDLDYTLTVQPRTMATGTQNPVAGDYFLDSVPDVAPPDGVPDGVVSVPPQCEGARRCPLLVFLGGGGQRANNVAAWLRPGLFRHGIILLAVGYNHHNQKDVDAALKETLRRFAIDPDKIGIVSRCISGGVGFGLANLPSFSRLLDISSSWDPGETSPPSGKTVEVLLDAGIEESDFLASDFAIAAQYRQLGYQVRHTITLRGHEHQAEEYELVVRWLAESWAKPPAQRTAPVVLDPLPLLTTDALAKLRTFWAGFFQAGHFVKSWARLPYIRDFVAPVGEARPVVPMTDMAALGEKYPEVAADLKAAGLTGPEQNAYRLALITAVAAQSALGAIGTITPTSVLARNMAFLEKHPDELEALRAVGGMDDKSFDQRGFSYCCPSPDAVEDAEPLGFWRTP